MQNSYRQQYPNLTDEDVNYKAGKFEDMIQRVALRTNRSRHEVEDDICNWLDD